MKAEIWNSPQVERDEKHETCAEILSSLVRVVDLIRLPVVCSDVEGKGINSVIMGKGDILRPGINGVVVDVAHHVMGNNKLGVVIPLRNYRNKIAERIRENGRWRRDGTIPESNTYSVIEG